MGKKLDVLFNRQESIWGADDLKNSLGYAEYECAFKLKPLHSAFWVFCGEITIGDFRLTYDEKDKIIHGRVRIRLEVVNDDKALDVAREKIERANISSTNCHEDTTGI